MLQLMEKVLDSSDRRLLFLIDRLDLCRPEEHGEFSVMKELIPRLQKLGHQYSRVQVMVTTARIAPCAVPESYLNKDSDWLLVNDNRRKSHR